MRGPFGYGVWIHTPMHGTKSLLLNKKVKTWKKLPWTERRTYHLSEKVIWIVDVFIDNKEYNNSWFTLIMPQAFFLRVLGSNITNAIFQVIVPSWRGIKIHNLWLCVWSYYVKLISLSLSLICSNKTLFVRWCLVFFWRHPPSSSFEPHQ